MEANTLIKEKIKEIEELYKTGLSHRDLGKIYGCSGNTIGKYLKIHGVTPNKSRSISLKAKGRTSSVKGRTLSEERRRQIGSISKGNKYCVGRVLSEESKKKMSEKRKAFLAKNPDAMKYISTFKKNQDPEISKRKVKIRARYKNMILRLTRLQIYTKKGKTHKELGYTMNEFKNHIESQFLDGMSWDKRNQFHIDHIVPVNVFIEKGVIEPRIVNALINLRPMFCLENHKKSDNYEIENFELDLHKIKKSIGLYV